MLAPILLAVPSLVKLAEELFAKKESEEGPQGGMKKAFVLESLGKLWDGLVESGKVPSWLPRSVVMGLCSWLIDVAAARFFPNA